MLLKVIVRAMPATVRRLLSAAVLLLGLSPLPAQVRVAPAAPTGNVAGSYTASSWSNLQGRKRFTTPLLNLTFVTDSGFLLAQRGEADRALPASLRLAGLDRSDFQGIADAVQDAFVAALRAQGFEVMPYDPLAVDPGFQELARHALRTGRDEPVPVAYAEIAGRTGARRTMTFAGHRCPWITSFMLDNYLPATRLTRQLDATLPIVSFLVEFAAYSPDRAQTYDWAEFMPAPPPAGVPRLRARPQVFVSAGTAAFLTPDGQTATLALSSPIGGDLPFVVNLAAARGRSREERQGGAYEVRVDPAAYRRAVIELLQPQVEAIARRLAAATP
jgi:hypothetical protein